jgi:WD40 repeat protein
MLHAETARLPYPGLRPFEADEADLFFGREQHVDALLARLSRSHFVAVVGESGAGKSSLVRAGLLPALEAGFVVEAGSDWRVVLMRPGSTPMTALAEALLAPGVLSNEGGAPSREFALAELRRGPLGLVQIVRDAHLPEHCNTLIVVDQFEELFRYCREPVQKDQANIFVELLLSASQQRQTPIFVVLTMRSDFVGDCARFRGLPEILNDNQYLTPRLTREQIAAAIREPARVCGGVVESPLVDELCNAVGDDQDQLPLLQHLLMRAWDTAARESNPPCLTSDIAHRKGGLRSALKDHAQQIYDALSPNGQAIARAMFRSLTDPRSQRRDLRRDAVVSEVAAVAAVPVDDVIAVADEFRAAGRHMLMPPSTRPLDAGSRLDISHESLIRQWSSLNEWSSEERINALEFDRLRDEARLEQAEKGELLSGKDLARALDWIRQAAPTPAWAERYAPAGELETTLAFIRKSEAESSRRKNEELRIARRAAHASRNKRLGWIALVAAVAAIAVSISVIRLWMDAESGRLDAHASQLTANALLEMDNDPALAMLLARTAVIERPLAEGAVDALRKAIAAHVPSVIARFTAARSINYIDSGKTLRLDFSLSPASISTKEDVVLIPSGMDAILWSTMSGQEVGRLGDHGGIVGAARFSPDGALAVTTSADNKARVWNVSTRRLAAPPIDHGSLVNNAVFSRDGSLFITLADDDARIWKAGNYTEPHCTLVPDGGNFIAASFSEDQRFLATVTQAFNSWQAQVWDVSTRACRPVPRSMLDDSASENIQTANFSETGPWLALVTTRGEVRILNTAGPRWSLKYTIPPAERNSQFGDYRPHLVWSKNGENFAFVGADNIVRVGSVQRDGPPDQLSGHAGEVTSISFNPAASMLLTTSADRTARVWTLRGGQPLVLRGHAEAIGSGAFSRTGSQIVTASDDGQVRSWSPIASRQDKFPGLRAISYSADGKQIWASGSSITGEQEKLWVAELDSVTFTPGKRQEVATGNASRIVFGGHAIVEVSSRSGDGDELRITMRDVRNPASAVELPSEALGTERRLPLFTSPTGQIVAVVGPNDETTIGDLQTPAVQPERRPPPDKAFGYCGPLGISDDKRLAWYCPEANKVLVDDPLQPQQRVEILVAGETRVEMVRFSTSGRWLAAVEDNAMEVFDLKTGKQQAAMKGHLDRIRDVAFSKDDRLVLTVSEDSSARVWDVTSGAQIAISEVDAGLGLSGVAFSPDGFTVLLRAADTLLVWRCHQCGDTSALLDEVLRRKLEERKLTPAEEKRFALTSAKLNTDGRETRP